MNILLVNPGRQVAFFEQLNRTELGTKNVYVAENDLAAPVCAVNPNTNIKISRALDPDFINDVARVCQEKRIDYLFSFLDYGAKQLAAHKAQFQNSGTQVVISSPDAVQASEDKYLFSQKVAAAQLPSVPTFTDRTILRQHSFPLFCKPRYGNSSQGTVRIETEKELDFYLSYPDTIAQPFMKEREFGVDLLIKNGKLYDIFMKEKLSLRAGTTDKAISFWDDTLLAIMQRLAQVFEFDGPVDVDVFFWKGQFIINEVNPRFGGGYAAAIACGKNFFERYLLDRPNINFNDYPAGVKTVRYEQTVAIRSV